MARLQHEACECRFESVLVVWFDDRNLPVEGVLLALAALSLERCVITAAVTCFFLANVVNRWNDFKCLRVLSSVNSRLTLLEILTVLGHDFLYNSHCQWPKCVCHSRVTTDERCAFPNLSLMKLSAWMENLVFRENHERSHNERLNSCNYHGAFDAGDARHSLLLTWPYWNAWRACYTCC